VLHRSTAAIEGGVTHIRGCERVASLLEFHSPGRHAAHERRGSDEHAADMELDQARRDAAARRKGGDRRCQGHVLIRLRRVRRRGQREPRIHLDHRVADRRLRHVTRVIDGRHDERERSERCRIEAAGLVRCAAGDAGSGIAAAELNRNGLSLPVALRLRLRNADRR